MDGVDSSKVAESSSSVAKSAEKVKPDSVSATGSQGKGQASEELNAVLKKAPAKKGIVRSRTTLKSLRSTNSLTKGTSNRPSKADIGHTKQKESTVIIRRLNPTRLTKATVPKEEELPPSKKVSHVHTPTTNRDSNEEHAAGPTGGASRDSFDEEKSKTAISANLPSTPVKTSSKRSDHAKLLVGAQENDSEARRLEYHVKCSMQQTVRSGLHHQLEQNHPGVFSLCRKNLGVFFGEVRKTDVKFSPYHHLAMEQVTLAVIEFNLSMKRRLFAFDIVRDNIANLYCLYHLISPRSSSAAQSFGELTGKLLSVMSDLTTKAEQVADQSQTNWAEVAKLMRPLDDVKPTIEVLPNLSEISTVRLLGAGGFGSVHKITYGGLTCAVKLIPKSKFRISKHACVEKIVACMTNHRCIVKYYCTFSADVAYVTILEYIRGVDLQKCGKEEVVPDDILRHVLAQIIIGVQYLHFKGFIHRDIKPSNIMITPGCHIKLIDYDTIRVCIGRYYSRAKLFGPRTIAEFSDRESAGTLPFISPEILQQKPYGRSTDWYAVGVTAYALTVGRIPFMPLKDVTAFKVLLCTADLEFPERRPLEPPLKYMIQGLLNRNGKMRIGSTGYGEFRMLDFFKDFPWEKVEAGLVTYKFPYVSKRMVGCTEEQLTPPPFLAIKPGSKRVNLSMEELKDTSEQLPLFTFSSPEFQSCIRKVKSGEQLSKDDINSTPDFIMKQQTGEQETEDKQSYLFVNYLVV